MSAGCILAAVQYLHPGCSLKTQHRLNLWYDLSPISAWLSFVAFPLRPLTPDASCLLSGLTRLTPGATRGKVRCKLPADHPGWSQQKLVIDMGKTLSCQVVDGKNWWCFNWIKSTHWHLLKGEMSLPRCEMCACNVSAHPDASFPPPLCCWAQSCKLCASCRHVKVGRV